MARGNRRAPGERLDLQPGTERAEPEEPTLAEVEAAAAALRERTSASTHTAEAEMWVEVLREHPSDFMPRRIRAWLARFIEREHLDQRGRGKKSLNPYRRALDAADREVIAARVAWWRRKLREHKRRAWSAEAFAIVAKEVGFGVEAVKDCWKQQQYWDRRLGRK